MALARMSLGSRLARRATTTSLGALTVALVVSGTFSSALYYLDWFKYYDTRRRVIEQGQEASVRQLALCYEVGDERAKADAEFEERVRGMLRTLRGRISISGVDPYGKDWQISGRDWTIDEDRTLVGRTADLGDYNKELSGVEVTIVESNRPPYLTSLMRAWFWSAPDLSKDAENWWEYRLYMRSVPLWAPFVVLATSLFLLLRQLARSAHYQLTLLQNQLDRASNSVTVQREELARKDAMLAEAKVARAEVDAETRAEMARLTDQLEREHQELDVLSRQQAELESTNAESARRAKQQEKQDQAELERLKAEKASAEAKLREQIARSRAEIDRLQQEKAIQEKALIEELEVRQEEIESIRRDRDAQKQLLDEAEAVLSGVSQKAMDVGKKILVRFNDDIARVEQWIKKLDSQEASESKLTQEDPRFRRLERQIGRWLVSPSGSPAEAWSEHSRKDEVIKEFRKLDPVFVSKYVVLARNGKYNPHQAKCIVVRRVGDEDKMGELEVVLDEARTLCLRYRLRAKKGVPDVDRIGFALAVILRVVSKQFEEYQIR